MILPPDIFLSCSFPLIVNEHIGSHEYANKQVPYCQVFYGTILGQGPLAWLHLLLSPTQLFCVGNDTGVLTVTGRLWVEMNNYY